MVARYGPAVPEARCAMMLTPEHAQRLLATLDVPRFNLSTVDHYMREMVAGNFRHSVITLSKYTSKLLDGRHRCYAV